MYEKCYNKILVKKVNLQYLMCPGRKHLFFVMLGFLICILYKDLFRNLAEMQSTAALRNSQFGWKRQDSLKIEPKLQSPMSVGL